MKNNKGFTMIELLGAVVILGILMLVAIPAVSSFIKNGKEKYYITQRKNLENAAKTYMKNNKVILRNVGDVQDIPMNELVSNKYISIIKDAEKKDCIGEKETDSDSQAYTFVRVKKEKDGVSYTTHLWCPNIKDEAFVEGTAEITFDFPDATNKEIIVNMSSPSVNIVKYTYVIFKGKTIADMDKADNTLVTKTENVNSLTTSMNYNVARFLKGKVSILHVYVLAVDADGNYAKAWHTYNFGDSSTFRCWTPTPTPVTPTPADDDDDVDDDDAIGDDEPADTTPTVTIPGISYKRIGNQYRVKWEIICDSTYGCESDVYQGTVTYSGGSYTARVTVKDKVTGDTGQCASTWSLPVITPEPTPTPIPAAPAAPTGVGCPNASIHSTGWQNRDAVIYYVPSAGTTRWRYLGVVSKGNYWTKLSKSTGKKIHFKKDTSYNNSKTWNTTPASATRTVIFTSTGVHYFTVRVEQKKSKDGTLYATFCGDPYYGTAYAYGPYRVDKTKPTVSGTSVKAKQLKITVKYTAKDKHSGLDHIYVNQSSTAKASTIKSSGKNCKGAKTCKWNKTNKYKKGNHTFYAHVLDRAGNITNKKVGKAKAVKLKNGCNYVGTKIHGSYTWHCPCGRTHSTAYFRYCVKNGKVSRAGSPMYYCPRYGKNEKIPGKKRLKGY
ncbi:MAG: prepilin-type N-terminal cleavage/methylation domain-containing protein [Bacilli bacterium]|nr:prepilin-type N-terminal cleavage/methylation domain-containing protein [Bacilli bacterium]